MSKFSLYVCMYVMHGFGTYDKILNRFFVYWFPGAECSRHN